MLDAEACSRLMQDEQSNFFEASLRTLIGPRIVKPAESVLSVAQASKDRLSKSVLSKWPICGQNNST